VIARRFHNASPGNRRHTWLMPHASRPTT
jgi:hypothetical protein